MSVQTNDLFLILLHGYIGKGYEYEYIGETFWRGVFQKTSILTTFTLILYKELPKAARWRGWENSETLKLEMSWKNWHKFLYSSRIQNNTTLHLSIRYVNFIHFDLTHYYLYACFFFFSFFAHKYIEHNGTDIVCLLVCTGIVCMFVCYR